MKYQPPLNAHEFDDDKYYDFDEARDMGKKRGSIPPAAAFEAVQREVVNAISAGGEEPNSDDNTQLTQAIKNIAGALPTPETEQTEETLIVVDGVLNLAPVSTKSCSYVELAENITLAIDAAALKQSKINSIELRLRMAVLSTISLASDMEWLDDEVPEMDVVDRDYIIALRKYPNKTNWILSLQGSCSIT